MAAEDDIRAANLAFYRAFAARDFDSLSRLWAQDNPVSCVHPGMAPIDGREAVLRSWKGLLEHPRGPALTCADVVIRCAGEFAWVTCLEGKPGGSGKLLATNIYVRENGEWRICHHHSGALAPVATDESQVLPDTSKGPWSLN